jgi:hypothetical protein
MCYDIGMKTASKSDPSTDLLKLSDFCCIINAIEGMDALNDDRPANCGDEAVDAYHTRRRKRRTNLERQRQMIYDLMIAHANKLVAAQVPLPQLDAAIHAAGWTDQHFIADARPSVTIVEN